MSGRRSLRVEGGGAIAGLVAAGLALGVAELVAGAIGRPASPAVVVGGAAIDRTPRFLKEFAIEHFGQNDKTVLLAGIFVVIAVLAAGIGVLGTYRIRAGLAGVLGFGLVAAAAAASRPAAVPVDVLPSLTAGVAGMLALPPLLRSTGARRSTGGVVRATIEDGGSRGPETTSGAVVVATEPGATGAGRRGVLVTAGLAVVAAVTGFGGRALQTRRADVDASRRAVMLPRPVTAATPLPSGARLDLPGISPFFTANRDFYRVDTALSVPRLTTDAWKLRIHGMVATELELSYADLIRRPAIERDITMTCVSNEVGGQLLGTARWLGIELAPLLREAGIRPGADQLVSRSVDGMTIGTPVAAVTDGRAAMLAIAMNGEPLPPEHGFPVRMIVPGLYGYVSGTKWVVDLELSTFASFDAYWVRRGWAAQAAIRTSSRIDTPKPLATVRPGKVMVGGTAWAQHRGVSKVEVRIDGGAWREARLSTSVTADLWRQWVVEWDAVPGSHTLQVRATDGTGETQTQTRTPPFPSGSTGWQSVVVRVAA